MSDTNGQQVLFPDPERLTRHQLIRRGPVVGACTTYIFSDHTSTQYAGKYASANHVFMRVNEVVASRLAACLGLNAPQVVVRIYKGERVLLSPWAEGRNCREMLGRIRRDRRILSNWKEVLLLACFDKLVMNSDRHLDNIKLVPKDDVYQVWAIDHDKVLYHHSEDGNKLVRNDSMPCSDPNLSHEEFTLLLNAVQPKSSDWEDAVQVVEALTDRDIDEAIEDPQLKNEVFFTSALKHRAAVVLKSRRDNISQCIREYLRGPQVRSMRGGN